MWCASYRSLLNLNLFPRRDFIIGLHMSVLDRYLVNEWWLRGTLLPPSIVTGWSMKIKSVTHKTKTKHSDVCMFDILAGIPTIIFLPIAVLQLQCHGIRSKLVLVLARHSPRPLRVASRWRSLSMNQTWRSHLKYWNPIHHPRSTGSKTDMILV